ncbi:MAG: ATP-binding protein, partial [Bacteroidales bacterium]
KSINSEINFENLLQSLLEKMKIVKSFEKSSALVFDKNINTFKFKASLGWELRESADVKISLNDAEMRYLKNAEEVFEDIFLKTDFREWGGISILDGRSVPKSMLILVIRVENRVEAFLIFENMNRENAFETKDLSFIKNSKEHIISAFIRTRILEDLQNTLQNLKATQDQLIQSEKLASLGALIAGIAHEIQNPLNFVNNFSSLSADLSDELLGFLKELKGALTPEQYANIEEVIGMIKGNVKKINDHGKRAESIVKGMLQHSRGRTGEYEQVDINNLVSEYVNLAYHGMRAKDKSFNTSIKTQLDPGVGKASIIPQDLSRVILNIVNNSCYALDEKVKKHIPGFIPEVVISTKKIKDKIEIRIRDNGTGIPEHVREKIFNPFFTTKPTGQGTGLGLSMSFDIVTQIHKGKLEVKSMEGEFTEFIITIPENQS